MPMSDFDRQIPAMTERVRNWLAAHGRQPAGKPFLRNHAIDMADRMDVELGIPVVDGPGVDGESVTLGVLPTGRYAVFTYEGVRNGVSANRRLLSWVKERGEKVVCHDSERGEVFGARYETFLTDARVEPDQSKWRVEVAMQLCG